MNGVKGVENEVRVTFKVNGLIIIVGLHNTVILKELLYAFPAVVTN